MKKYCIVVICTLFMCVGVGAQEIDIADSLSITHFTRADFEHQLESMSIAYRSNKRYPDELELECLAALSFYPELKDTKIRFFFDDDLKPMMQSIPCDGEL